MLKWRSRNQLVLSAASNRIHTHDMKKTDETSTATGPKFNELPPVEYLLECFSCDADTGILIWNRRPEHHFPSNQAMLAWNGKCAGKKAGYYHGRTRRLMVGMENYGKTILGHRVIWTMLVGPIPVGMQIDHINGDPSDNRLVNLRLATNQQNSLNSRRKSGPGVWRGLPRGVSPSYGGKFRAKIRINYKEVCLGTFNTPEEAHEAYKKAHVEVAGEFANREVTT